MIALVAALLQQPQDLEFFENRIRPVLALECYSCHSRAAKVKGGLELDHRAGLLKGGDSGPAIVPGKPDESLLLRTVRHLEPDLKMPRAGAKLDVAVIRDLEDWIRRGAPDPRLKPSSKEDLARDTSFAAVLRLRRRWWSFEPVAAASAPLAVDRLLATDGPEVDARALYRRLSFAITGLPPSPEETEAFAAAPDVAAAADRLLASPAFGERWARHWMDWIRYAETHGSEGDPAIPFAWRYRDYLVRALNADVPIPRLVREHLAGDLLPDPRVLDGVSESALGAAHFRMVPHGFTPTDARDEFATFTDNQVDTVTKSFLGLTVACARCHDHKFDAVSQADYTAMHGIFASTRPATVDVRLPAARRQGADRMDAAKAALREALAETWAASIDAALDRLAAARAGDVKDVDAFAAWARGPAGWEGLRAEEDARAAALAAFRGAGRTLPLEGWGRDGPSVDPVPAGAFHVPHDGDRVIEGPFPAGSYSHLLTTRHRGVLHSPPFQAGTGKLFVRVRGGGKAKARYVVQNYPRSGLIYPKAELNSTGEKWVSWSLDYWKGDLLHVELATDLDQPVEHSGSERSWFGIAEAVVTGDPKVPAPPLPPSGLSRFGGEAPADAAALRARYAEVLRRCIAAWRSGTMSDLEADFLEAFVRKDWLPNRLPDLPPAVAERVKAARAAERELLSPVRAPGLLEGFASDAPLLARGDPKHPGSPVPRRFLEAFDERPYAAGPARSGRLELADGFVSAPLFSRVMANRIWHHVFGTPLAGTPDNLGRLGDAPVNPALLEHLAARFQASGGSLKALVRDLVQTRAFRLARPPRRLEAEAIRDSLLALSGRLERGSPGPSVDGGAPRRSVYVRVLRNDLDPFLSAFDFPVPSGARGRRDVTNVPAQALAFLNSPLVARWAADWARRVGSDPRWPDDAARVRRLFAEAFGRPASDEELRDAAAFLAGGSLVDLARALLQAKEFTHVR